MPGSLLSRVVPPWVRVAEHHGPYPVTAGLPEEQHLAPASGTGQRLQSLVARDQARRALSDWTDHAGAPIWRGAGGAPQFPDGFVGSLTHTRHFAGAAVAAAGPVSFGIDAERARLLGGDHRPFATDREDGMLRRLRRTAPWMPWDVLLFSAKESAYKASYPLERQWRPMTGAEAHLSPDGRFSVWIPRTDPCTGPGYRLFHGRWALGRGLIATFAAVGVDASAPTPENTPEFTPEIAPQGDPT